MISITYECKIQNMGLITDSVSEAYAKEFKLPFANSNIPRTQEEKDQIIEKAAKAYEAYMDALGFDWRNDPNSSNTPYRVAKAFVNELAAGCYAAPPKITSFPSNGYDGMVFEGGIPVKSLCAHHHLAFSGVCYIGYISTVNSRVVGLSKLNRIVEFYARRPNIQESLVLQIADAVDKACEGNKGVAVMISASHTCVCNRGVNHNGCEMKTSKLMGDFLTDPATRSEFYTFIANMKG